MSNIEDPSDRSDRLGSNAGTACRLGAAAVVLVSGLVHVQLYYDGFRDFPDANLGRSFVLNGVASVAVTVALLFRRDVVVRLAAAGVLIGTLIAFALSRTDTGIFGFTERGLNPSPQAGLALAAEIIGLVLLAATFVPAIGPGDPLPALPAAITGGAVVVLAVVGAALWAQEDDAVVATPPASDATTSPTTAAPTTAAPATSAAAPGESSPSSDGPTTAATTTAVATTAPSGVVEVSIADFAFDAATLEIPVGTTVRWVNNDAFSHTVVADDGSFESEELGGGATFEFTFTVPGTFDYTCGIHPSMFGQVVVTA